jgi:hypothetical protein
MSDSKVLDFVKKIVHSSLLSKQKCSTSSIIFLATRWILHQIFISETLRTVKCKVLVKFNIEIKAEN